MPIELTHILFLDIETIACTWKFEDLDPRLKVQWSRKTKFLRKDSELSDEELFKTKAGIFAEFGKIICIAVGMLVKDENGELRLRTKAYSGKDEKQLLLSFKNMVEKLDHTQTRFCAHNGKEFDYPYICRRMLINQISLPDILNISNKKPWEVLHLDTLEMWKFGDYKNYTSLDLLASIFDVPSSKSDMDGSMVNHVYYNEDGLDRITNYSSRMLWFSPNSI
jgi:DNA polymerase elongation subunit (family B)